MQKPQKPFVTTIKASKIEKLRQDLISQGFELTFPEHTYFQAKKPHLTCTLYTSLKLTVQGSEMASFIEFYLEPELLERLEYTQKQEVPSPLDQRARIGVDEAGKGDFFGPLCIAACFVDDGKVDRLLQLGVRDSKELNDKEVRRIATLIQQEFQHSIIRIFPLKYNELYSTWKNLNKMLAWGHATAIENLSKVSNCKVAIIDQFAGEHVVLHALSKKNIQIDLTQKTKGESDPAVAAASILARAAFLEGLEKLGKEIGSPLPKGASKAVIDAAKQLVQTHGPEILARVSKQHFKTTLDVLGVKEV